MFIASGCGWKWGVNITLVIESCLPHMVFPPSQAMMFLAFFCALSYFHFAHETSLKDRLWWVALDFDFKRLASPSTPVSIIKLYGGDILSLELFSGDSFGIVYCEWLIESEAPGLV